ncbi:MULTISPECIES: ABC transporter permease [Rhizobium]|uniref:ABC transporter permease n=1 Tax=Rhizobium TaxID=379 RepID=UPI001C92BBE3|nr:MULTISPECIES: ABC transporter permease [Rhizobium]MBY4592209.1 ABC transporter permease [Rhizobium redzepovicii]MBY4617140.1 ABC transporter permease [Rhizobium redzepovicii]ULJ81494.1 ABC transporter permease [Rhizobium sp. C104]
MNTITVAVPAASLSPIRRSYSFMALTPAALFLSVFFALPMGMMIGISFSQEEVGGFSVESYRRFFTDGLSVAGFCRTAVMSGLVAIAVTVLGYPVAYFLARSRSRWRALVFALALAPELAGVVLRTYGWLIILEDRGFINDVLLDLGLISSPLPLSKNLFAVVVGLTHVVLPFGILSLMTSIQGIDESLERAAQMLGASRVSVVRHVIVPLSVPGLVSSLLLSFTMAASAYATPALLGGAGFKVLATMISEQVLFYVDWPFAAVMANALLLLMLVISFVGVRFEARHRTKRSGAGGATS